MPALRAFLVWVDGRSGSGLPAHYALLVDGMSSSVLPALRAMPFRGGWLYPCTVPCGFLKQTV